MEIAIVVSIVAVVWIAVCIIYIKKFKNSIIDEKKEMEAWNLLEEEMKKSYIDRAIKALYEYQLKDKETLDKLTEKEKTTKSISLLSNSFSILDLTMEEREEDEKKAFTIFVNRDNYQRKK